MYVWFEMSIILPSVLWRCWLGVRKSMWHVNILLCQYQKIPWRPLESHQITQVNSENGS